MVPRFSIVYPTRDRPQFIAQALGILAMQGLADFEVVISDNNIDPALSCREICIKSTVPSLTYVRPPTPVGMVENWNHALQYATGDYILFLTDKMFVLPGSLATIDEAIGAAGGPEIVSWTSDAYNPVSFRNYLGEGIYVPVAQTATSRPFRRFSPSEELDRRGRAAVSRGEQNPADYCRGKLVFGAYRRELVERILGRYGRLFHDINPDYTSMILGLTEARDAIEMAQSSVVSVNTDISNGQLCDTDDRAALRFLDSLAGGSSAILPGLLVPGAYASLHNWVAHDFQTLKRAFGLAFEFDVANWLVYCVEDVERTGRQWSEPAIEAEQKALVSAFLASLEPDLSATVRARLAARRAPGPTRRTPRQLVPPALRRSVRRLLPRPEAQGGARWASSIESAVGWTRNSARPGSPAEVGSPGIGTGAAASSSAGDARASAIDRSAELDP